MVLPEVTYTNDICFLLRAQLITWLFAGFADIGGAGGRRDQSPPP